jgi:hypothetical protein
MKISVIEKIKRLPAQTEESLRDALSVLLNVEDRKSDDHYMDRRVGKRTLVKTKDEVETLPEWVKQFYNLRCETEKIAS